MHFLPAVQGTFIKKSTFVCSNYCLNFLLVNDDVQSNPKLSNISQIFLAFNIKKQVASTCSKSFKEILQKYQWISFFFLKIFYKLNIRKCCRCRHLFASGSTEHLSMMLREISSLIQDAYLQVSLMESDNLLHISWYSMNILPYFAPET